MFYDITEPTANTDPVPNMDPGAKNNPGACIDPSIDEATVDGNIPLFFKSMSNIGTNFYLTLSCLFILFLLLIGALQENIWS